VCSGFDCKLVAGRVAALFVLPERIVSLSWPCRFHGRPRLLISLRPRIGGYPPTDLLSFSAR